MNVEHGINILNKPVKCLEKDGYWDWSNEDINAVTVQNAGNEVAYLNDKWYFPPGSVINLGSQSDGSKYKGKVTVRFTGVIIEDDPSNPIGANPVVQAWPVYAEFCKCKTCRNV